MSHPYIVFILKMKSVLIQKYRSCPKNECKKLSRKIYFDLHAGNYFSLLYKREEFCPKSQTQLQK